MRLVDCPYRVRYTDVVHHQHQHRFERLFGVFWPKSQERGELLVRWNPKLKRIVFLKRKLEWADEENKIIKNFFSQLKVYKNDSFGF